MKYMTTDDAFCLRRKLYEACDAAGISEADSRSLVCSMFQTAARGKIRRNLPKRAYRKNAEFFVWRVVGAWCGCKRFGQYVQGVNAVIVKKFCPKCIIGASGERVPYDAIIGFTID